MKACRIWTTFDQNGALGGMHRILSKITRNEFDDYLFHLDGGEVWQFTTRARMATAPTVENVAQLGIGQDRNKKPLPFMCFLVLKNKEHCTGNLRVFPPMSEAARESRGEQKPPQPPPNPKGRKPEYDRKEDARVFDLWAEADAAGCPSIERFREENDAIKKAYTLWELRKLIDREGKRRRKELAEMRKAQKSKKRQ